MENTEISMFMDVKMELNERKMETVPFKNWTKCLVKVDAVKCFPCYLRITFIKNVEDEFANLCVRINIPGVSIRMAKSRTKAYSYGIFYTQNRKRCTIFFSLDSEECYELHIKWMKRSIRILELHRQAIIENKHTNRIFEDNIRTMGEMKEGRTLQDILGPLPKIPVDLGENSEWSRRVSGVSGIYEEIPEDGRNPQFPRTSVASGIYEEMKLPENIELIRDYDIANSQALNYLIPPPLPPRKRISTLEGSDIHVIRRCNTNPEDNTAKKKRHMAILGNVFGHEKRSESVTEGKVCSTTDFICKPEAHFYGNLVKRIPTETRSRNKFGVIFSSKAGCSYKATSFSNPDLRACQPEIYGLRNAFSSSDYFGQMFNTLISNFENLNTRKNDELVKSEIVKLDKNLKDNVLPVLGTSVAQLVNADSSKFLSSTSLRSAENNKECKNTDLSPYKILIEDLSGYCIMAPIKERDDQSHILEDSDKENKGTIASKIEQRKNYEQEEVYESINRSENYYVNTDNYRSNNITHIYQNIKSEAKIVSNDNCKNREDYFQKITKRNVNIDEKIPSYYPNIYDFPPKPRKRMNSNSSDRNNQSKYGSNTIEIRESDCYRENLFLSPQRIQENKKLISSKVDVKSKPIFASPLKCRKISENIYTVTKLHDFSSLNYVNKQNDIISYSKQTIENRSSIPRVVSGGSGSSLKKQVELGSITVRKFSSLPRFRKIDFSPLRLKINSVLQRHNSEGL